MQILYDVSVIVQGHYVARARTGVFRVAENVARGLAAAEECDLVFCVAENVAEPIDFLRADARFRRVPLSLTGAARFWRGLYGKAFGMTARIESGASKAGALPLKAVRKLAYHAAEAVRPYAPPFDPAALRSADIYHSPFHPLPALVRGDARVKKFVTIYDLIPLLQPRFFEPDVNDLLRQILASMDRDSYALCISRATRDDLCNYSKELDPDKLFVTHLAASELFYPCADADRLAAVRDKYGIPADARYVLSLSTLEPRKNIDQVVRCFARLVREQGLKDLRLVLTGTKGWDYGRIFEAISDCDNLRDYIILTGYVADEDLAPLYSGALAFVYPSFYEGFGLPPLEAMQCGTPVITSNTSSLPEVVGDAGVMLDPADADGICQSMLDVYNDGALRAELSRRSLERAALFSWEKCTRETINAYRAALGR